MTAKDLTGEFTQLGYVTRDLDRAIALYRDRYGVPEFMRFNTAGNPLIPPMDVALAYRGPVMIELIQPNATSPGIYKDALRDDGGVNLHHLGYLSEEPKFSQLHAEFEAEGLEMLGSTKPNPMGPSLFYVDTRADIGVWSEFICLGEAGKAFFAQIPRS